MISPFFVFFFVMVRYGLCNIYLFYCTRILRNLWIECPKLCIFCTSTQCENYICGYSWSRQKLRTPLVRWLNLINSKLLATFTIHILLWMLNVKCYILLLRFIFAYKVISVPGYYSLLWLQPSQIFEIYIKIILSILIVSLKLFLLFKLH